MKIPSSHFVGVIKSITPTKNEDEYKGFTGEAAMPPEAAQTYMKIGNLTLKNNLVMAPMAGYTDWPFRQILSRFKCSLAFTEMISAKALSNKNSKTLEKLCFNAGKKHFPVGMQLAGSDIPSMIKATESAQEMDYDLIDLNIGCPARKIAKSGSGAKLMQSPEKLKELIHSIRKTIKIPFTAKMRIGWDENSINAVEIARIAEGEGIDALFVHGRTRSAGYSGKPNLESIREVKENVGIPVFGNGDIKDVHSAMEMLEKTSCDGLMIGRHAFEDPSLFDRIDAAINCETIPPLPAFSERISLLKDLCAAIFDFYGDHIGCLRSRGILLFCIRSFRGASLMRKQISAFKSRKEFESFFDSAI